jgi:hypothetical protein
LPYEQEPARETHSGESLLQIEASVLARRNKINKMLKVNALDFISSPRPEFKVKGNEPVCNGICDR